ncbi:MAG TPA: serine/threonine-protein kinase [Verrucomicrobiae bacterium]|nr:serine/threonine-protein kinase [Verrucomicrobiae bacterium]
MANYQEREQALFVLALEKPALERQAFLDRECAGDGELRARLEALFAAHDRSAPLLDAEPKFAQATMKVATAPENPNGQTIGRYKLLQRIGEGGCGVVYMAEQEEPVRRRVALKIIKLGMDTKQVIARFEAERQALAMMDHPNIARVLDAGATETGRPYFVMELVRGIKITDFCDENKLSTEDRLKLFVQVCQAIQHAHQKGIIHRDIKPSNILVTVNDGASVPKVIDFGIAKATAGRLTDQTLFTAFEQFIGTPAYMSPEQAVMTSLDIDTRSDVYSLGVLLYELLTGYPPFDQKELLAAGLDEMRRTIREREPPKPSTRLTLLGKEELTTAAQRRQTEAPKLVHRVRGDLDWIVMKCLEKDRTRRYETANGLGADIQRHINNEPVMARPPGEIYRLQKWVKRNKLTFTATAAVFVALTAGLVVSSWMFFREKEVRQRAVAAESRALTEAARSEQVADFMTGMLKGAGPSVARGRDATLLREIVEQTAVRIEELSQQPEVQGDLWSVLGRTYEDIGDHTNAIVMYGNAVKSYRRAFQDDHTKLAGALGDMGSALSFVGRVNEGTNQAWQGLQMARKLGNELTVASCLVDYASSLRFWGLGTAESVPYLREALAIRQKFGTNDSLMHLYTRLGSSVTNNAEGLALNRVALNYALQKHGEEDTKVAFMRFVSGQRLLNLNRMGEAEEELGKAWRTWRKIYPVSHSHRAIVFRCFIQSLALQQKYQAAEAEIENEQRLVPTNTYCSTLAMALEINKGTWPIPPTNLLIKLESRINTNGNSFNAAIMSARLGRMEKYEQCVRILLSRAEERRNFTRAEQAAKAALLFPADPSVVGTAGKLADFAATATGPEDFLPWALSVKALAEYRRGNVSSAIELAERTHACPNVWPACQATTYCIQALAYIDMKDEVNARMMLSRVDQAEANYRNEILLKHGELDEYWGHRDWIMAGFLKREAEVKLNDLDNSQPARR